MSSRKVVSLVLVATLLSIAFVLALSWPTPVAASEDPGIIAYVRPSTHDIHLISPDGTGDQVLWTAPQPLSQTVPLDLAWRPDGRELAFSSDHEETCSWFQSDVYAIGYSGTGYRRVTNSPACAELASLPKGSVTVDVANYTSSLVWVYVRGAPGVKSILGSSRGRRCPGWTPARWAPTTRGYPKMGRPSPGGMSGAYPERAGQLRLIGIS